MNARLLAQAKGRLMLCERARAALEADLADEVLFQTHWGDFLTQWKGTYMKIQQAAKDTPQELQWFGGVNRDRRGDPLLRWLYEARNDEEHHGLLPSAEHRPNYHRMRATRDLEANRIEVLVLSENEVQALGPDGEISAVQIGFEEGVSELQQVTERDGKKKVPAPASHLGNSMEPKPLLAADLGLVWLRQLVAVADAMSTP